MSDNSKSLRFAVMPRVSTEKQEEKGESLRTQRKALEKDVALLGGRIVAWYGGQEHATGIEERKELKRLLADAGKDHFDAFMVAYAQRWDRGSNEAREVLEAFKNHGIRFFISVTEFSLYHPEHELFLDMSAAFGKFQANNQLKLSILNKIARAKRGCAACGDLPFGRTYDKETEKWGIDPKAQAMIADIARRFLKGESLINLAAEYGTSYSSLCKNLRDRCGDVWEQRFNCDRLNIHEVVPTPVPRLLDDKTIKAVCQRLDACRTYLHNSPQQKHDYLLRNFVFCSGCGRAYTGSVHSDTGVHYYRHAHRTKTLVSKVEEPCPYRSLGQQHIRAKELEQAVVKELFNLMGNPAAIERAINNAVPDVSLARTKQERLSAELDKIAKARDKILNLIAYDTLEEDEARKQLNELKERQALLKEELSKVDEELTDVPTEESIRCFLHEIEDVIVGVNGERGRAIWVENEYDEIVTSNTIGSFLVMTRP